MRKLVITKQWLADFYAEGVKPKYKGSIKRQAASNKQQAIKETVPWNDIAEAHAQPEVASDKPQASSTKRRKI